MRFLLFAFWGGGAGGSSWGQRSTSFIMSGGILYKMLCCVGSGLFHVPIAVYMMIFVPNTIETLDKLPDVQVGPDADAITIIPMGQGSVKLFIFVAIITNILIWAANAFPQCKIWATVLRPCGGVSANLAGNAEAVVGEFPHVARKY